MREIGKSPEMLQQEARISALLTQLKKHRTTLKRLKTRLKNTQEEINTLQRKVSTSYFDRLNELFSFKEVLVSLFKKCQQIKGISKEDKQQIAVLLEGLNLEDDEEYQDFINLKNQKENPKFEDDERAKMNDIFEEFRVKPVEKVAKDIRKVYVKLSVSFHPDKAKNDKESEDFHGIMQQINEAYKAGDIDKLLEIEEFYLDVEKQDLSLKSVTNDVLEAEIKRLEQRLFLTKNQVDRTSNEIKSLRASDLGQMLTAVNREDRQGSNFDAMMAEMDESIEEIKGLKEVLETCIEQQDLSAIYEYVQSNLVEEMMFDLFSEALDEDFFDDFD